MESDDGSSNHCSRTGNPALFPNSKAVYGRHSRHRFEGVTGDNLLQISVLKV